MYASCWLLTKTREVGGGEKVASPLMAELSIGDSALP
jgi:hypothetical protein